MPWLNRGSRINSNLRLLKSLSSFKPSGWLEEKKKVLQRRARNKTAAERKKKQVKRDHLFGKTLPAHTRLKASRLRISSPAWRQGCLGWVSYLFGKTLLRSSEGSRQNGVTQRLQGLGQRHAFRLITINVSEKRWKNTFLNSLKLTLCSIFPFNWNLKLIYKRFCRDAESICIHV